MEDNCKNVHYVTVKNDSWRMRIMESRILFYLLIENSGLGEDKSSSLGLR